MSHVAAPPAPGSTQEPARIATVAELDRRFYAFVLDRVIGWAVIGLGALLAYVALIRPGQVVAGVVVVVGVVALVGLVFAVLLGTWRVSPGTAALGLRTVHEGTGQPIGFGRALLRGLVLGVAGLPTVGLGLATLAWTAVMDPAGRRRGWHDRVAHSVVVDIRPVPVDDEEEETGPRHVVNLTAMRLVPAPAPDLVTPAPSARPPTAPGPTPVVPADPEPVEAAPEAAPLPVPAPSRGGAKQQLGWPLVAEPVVAGWRVTFDTGDDFVVEGLALVGRRPEGRDGEPVRHLVPLPSTDMSLSKTHAQFQVADDGSLVVMDRGSTNGSILVRQGVARELPAGRPVTLLVGDRVHFGDREMTVARAE